MLKTINSFIEVPSSDPDDRRKARILNIFIVGLGVIDISAILFVSGVMLAKVEGWQNLQSTFWSATAFLGMMGFLFWLNRSGKVIIGSSLFVITMTLAITGANVRTVGTGETQFYFMIPILIASVLIRPHVSFYSAAFNTLIFVTAALAFNLEPDFYIGIMGMFAVAFVSWLSARSLEDALRNVREINVELDQRVEQRTSELATANVRLEHQATELATANVQLKELDRLKSKFVSDVSHELRTPISNLSIYLEMLEGGNPDKRERYLAVLREETQRLENLVTDVLDLSRMETGVTASQFVWADLNELIDKMVTANRLGAEAKGLELTFEPGVDLPKVLVDVDLMNQALINLIANAINYTPEGSVNAKTMFDEDESLAILEIADTGVGIAASDTQHIFERFYRGEHAGQSTIPGTGLGLAITKEIIEKHGGSIDLKSEVGAGSVFTIRLPVAIKDKQE